LKNLGKGARKLGKNRVSWGTTHVFRQLRNHGEKIQGTKFTDKRHQPVESVTTVKEDISTFYQKEFGGRSRYKINGREEIERKPGSAT